MSICVGCRSPARVHCAASRSIYAQVVDEIGRTLTTTRAVARLHGKTTSFVDGVVASVGTPRLLCFLVMQAFRLAFALLLGYGGAYFIGKSIKLSDLILNCIALEVRSSFRHAVRGCATKCTSDIGTPGGLRCAAQRGSCVRTARVVRVRMLVVPGRCGSSACAAGYEP